MAGNHNSGAKPGCNVGHSNAAGRGKNQKPKEGLEAIARANLKLDKITERAVDVLEQILNDPKSTKMDLTHAAREVLARRIPTVTRADIELTGAPVVMLRIPGVNWPRKDDALPDAIAERINGANGA